MAKRTGGKTALVLAGGGLTGAVYEIGALRAIDDLLVDRTVNDFDIYVGTSAGALVASILALGMSPEEMLERIAGLKSEPHPIEPHHIFGFDWFDFARWGTRLPVKLAKTWLSFFMESEKTTLFDLLWSLAETLPPGLYDSLALEDYLRKEFTTLGASNDFLDLNHELHIIATDLDTGERVVFGPTENSEIGISLAVAASSALPLVYKPVRIGDTEFIDGGLRGTASLDLAIERGATLVVCINPLVPIDNSDRASSLLKEYGGYISGKGIQSIANQTIRIFSHAGLQYHVKQLRRAHPEVDIILIEPKAEDSQMFFYNMMRYSARMEIARHGFESVTLDLAKDYVLLKEVLARHDIPISRRMVISELNKIEESSYDPDVIRNVLEARTKNCGQQGRSDPICQLDRVLAELEMALDRQEE